MIKEVKYFPSQSAYAPPISIKIDWKRGEHTALCLFDNTKFADEARFQLRGRCLPNLTSRKLRIDFCDNALFDHSLRNQHDPEDMPVTVELLPVRLDTHKKIDLRKIKRERSRSRSSSHTRTSSNGIKRRSNGGSGVDDKGGDESSSSRNRAHSPPHSSTDRKTSSSSLSERKRSPISSNSQQNQQLVPSLTNAGATEELEEGQMEDDVKQVASSINGVVTTTEKSEQPQTSKDLTIDAASNSGSEKPTSTSSSVRSVYIAPFSPKKIATDIAPPSSPNKLLDVASLKQEITTTSDETSNGKDF